MQTTIYVVLGLVALGFLAIFIMSAMAGRPDNLGVKDGRLAAVPNSPNCVSTQATDDEHSIAPIPFDGGAEKAMSVLRSIVEEASGATVVSEADRYLHVEFRSQIFRFVDDVEFYIDDQAGVVHFRSASRVGHSDLGVNRKRMESIRRRFEARLNK